MPTSSRKFIWLEPVKVTENYVELVRHTGVCVALNLKSGCECCEALREAAEDFDFGEGGRVMFSGGEGAHHKLVQVRPPGTRAQYTLKMPTSKSKQVLRNALTCLFYVRPHHPLPHQKKLMQQAAAEPNVSRLIGWQLGSGKSDGSLFAFDAMECTDAVIIAGKTLLGQWWDALQYHPGKRRMRVRLFGYSRFAKEVHYDEELVEGACVAVDEVHRWKSFTAASMGSIQGVTKAQCVFMLTGTPLRNQPRDIDITLFLLGHEDLIAAEDDGEIVGGTGQLAVYRDPYRRRLKELRDCLSGQISLYDPKFSMPPAKYRKHYSRKKELLITHFMDWVTASELVLFGQGVNIRVNGRRVAVGGKGGHLRQLSILNCAFDEDKVMHSSKRDAVLAKIASIGEFPQVVYSRFKANMLDDLHEELRACDYGKIAVLTGDTPSERRHDLVREYNEGKIAVVLICRVGNEGVDLSRPAKALHLLEGQNNAAEEDQIIGRVVRFLPKPPSEQQEVLVLHYVCSWPKEDLSKGALHGYYRYAMGTSNTLRNAFKEDPEKVRQWVLREVREGPKTVEERIMQANREKAKTIKPLQIMLWMAAEDSDAPWVIKNAWEQLTGEPAGEKPESKEEKRERVTQERAVKKAEKARRSEAYKKRCAAAAAKRKEAAARRAQKLKIKQERERAQGKIRFKPVPAAAAAGKKKKRNRMPKDLAAAGAKKKRKSRA